MTVGTYYKWEDHNHGLEHKCGTCATVLSSPRAKKTCFGVHEEVCPAYHKTLHFVGASHKCAACSNTTRAHDKRHLEIAEYIQAIRRLEGNLTTESPLRNNKRKGEKRDGSNSDPSDDGSVPLNGLDPERVDPEREVEWSSNASTLMNDDDDAEGRKQWSGGMESPDVRKAAKAERKAAKNQVLFDIVTQDELTMVNKAVHPESANPDNTVLKGQGLADNRTIDENIAFNPNTCKWGKLRQGVHAKKIAKSNDGKQRLNALEQDKILGPILAQLDISTNMSKASRGRKSLDAKLRTAILGDLVAFENDQVETMQRMAGYWRYANKRTYNEMVRNNEIWDWATGEKLPEIREDPELDVIQEEDENAEAARTEGQISENWDDPEVELPINRKLGGSDTKLDEEVISKQSSSPGRFSGQTLNFNVLSTISSNESRDRLRVESGDHGKEAIQSVKDTRVFVKAIHNASPPFKDPPRAPPPITTPLLPTTQNKDRPDASNRFGTLNHEVPAPCEEVKKADPNPVKNVLRFPGKPIVKTLVVHDEQGGWQTARGSKGKKGSKGGPAAINVHAKKLAGGKTFAAVVKRL